MNSLLYTILHTKRKKQISHLITLVESLIKHFILGFLPNHAHNHGSMQLQTHAHMHKHGLPKCTVTDPHRTVTTQTCV